MILQKILEIFKLKKIPKYTYIIPNTVKEPQFDDINSFHDLFSILKSMKLIDNSTNPIVAVMEYFMQIYHSEGHKNDYLKIQAWLNNPDNVARCQTAFNKLSNIQNVHSQLLSLDISELEIILNLCEELDKLDPNAIEFKLIEEYQCKHFTKENVRYLHPIKCATLQAYNQLKIKQDILAAIDDSLKGKIIKILLSYDNSGLILDIQIMMEELKNNYNENISKNDILMCIYELDMDHIIIYDRITEVIQFNNY